MCRRGWFGRRGPGLRGWRGNGGIFGVRRSFGGRLVPPLMKRKRLAHDSQFDDTRNQPNPASSNHKLVSSSNSSSGCGGDNGHSPITLSFKFLATRALIPCSSISFGPLSTDAFRFRDPTDVRRLCGVRCCWCVECFEVVVAEEAEELDFWAWRVWTVSVDSRPFPSAGGTDGGSGPGAS